MLADNSSGVHDAEAQEGEYGQGQPGDNGEEISMVREPKEEYKRYLEDMRRMRLDQMNRERKETIGTDLNWKGEKELRLTVVGINVKDSPDPDKNRSGDVKKGTWVEGKAIMLGIGKEDIWCERRVMHKKTMERGVEPGAELDNIRRRSCRQGHGIPHLDQR